MPPNLLPFDVCGTRHTIWTPVNIALDQSALFDIYEIYIGRIFTYANIFIVVDIHMLA